MSPGRISATIRLLTRTVDDHEEWRVKTDGVDAITYCRDLTRQEAKNFYYAFLSLPRPKREAIYAVYAFCRYCDDVADSDQADPERQSRLDAWRLELDSCYAGKPTHLITQALQPIVHTYGIPKQYFEQLIDGVEMDLTIRRYATFADLEQYCYRVASVVGLMCVEIFGYRHPGIQDYARYLGIALQLTNIIRDVKEDAEHDRIYLPLEELRAFEVSEDSLLQQQHTAAFVALMQFQARRAEAYYRQAQACLLPGDKANLVAPEIMAGIYRATLRKIARRGYRVFQGRTRLSGGWKILMAVTIVVRIWLETRLVALQKPSTPSV